MINLLSYIGMSLQSEVCLWTLLGLLRTIFDATLFKVNANLKQLKDVCCWTSVFSKNFYTGAWSWWLLARIVWQMTMPEGISMPMQRVLRTMISGVMLVQCFTVYVYIAAYIVLLYPIFLEERPTLVLPWLLLAAVRRLLCELTCLALGLGICVLLGPTRASCVKFIILKMSVIIPGFYMWLLILRYYNVLKVASTYKTFPIILESNDQNHGLELAIRRRRTKSLFGEDQLRKKLTSKFERNSLPSAVPILGPVPEQIYFNANSEALESIKEIDFMTPLLAMSAITDTRMSDEWLGTGALIPRDSDRILEQFTLMLLQIFSYCKKEEIALKTFTSLKPQAKDEPNPDINRDDIDTESAETSHIDNGHGKITSYMHEYPKIFNKKKPELYMRHNNDDYDISIIEKDNSCEVIRQRKRKVTITPNETVSLEVKRIMSRRKVNPLYKKEREEKETSPLTKETKSKHEHVSRNLKRRKDYFKNNLDK